jgi:drug/metabolite transporter (DMT)-like permease
MTDRPMASATSAPDAPAAPSHLLAGLAWGLLAAAIWASYSVLARLAVKSGLSPGDLTLLRFAPGALLMAPLVWRWGWRDLAGIGWLRGTVLTLLAGPGFSLLFMTGFSLAPLAHGAVIAPACQMLAGLTLSAWLAHQGWTRESALGAACVAAGLACMGGDSLLHPASHLTLLGDALFAAAGACWGLFGALSRRWHVDPLRLTAVVVVLAFVMFAPPFLAVADLGRLARATSGMLVMQVLAQGLGAGLVAVLAYSRAAALLGSGRAAFFGALVPGAASLLAIPVLGEVPSLLQVLGIVAVVAGLLVAFGAVRLLLPRPGSHARP